MNEWGISLYGDPCRECGFSWAVDLDGATLAVTGTGAAYAALLRGATGRERHPDLAWSVSAYVCHVADNLRIWAERLAGIASGAGPRVAPYDESLLAEARQYGSIPLEAAMWSLGTAIVDWTEAVGRSARSGPVLVHPERGEQTLAEVVTSNAHDAAHHGWDIARTLTVAAEAVAPGPPTRESE
jgi:hypothetical protein